MKASIINLTKKAQASKQGNSGRERKQWTVPHCFLIELSLTAGKSNTTAAEGVVGTTNFCKINPMSPVCLNFGPS